MLYLSGIHALNLPCSLLTCGDWHTSGINWHGFVLLESQSKNKPRLSCRRNTKNFITRR
jgi:hypothetical protein